MNISIAQALLHKHILNASKAYGPRYSRMDQVDSLGRQPLKKLPKQSI